MLQKHLHGAHQQNQYEAFTTPAATNALTLHLKTNLTTGTYKVMFKLYDGSSFIGEAYEYIIIK